MIGVDTRPEHQTTDGISQAGMFKDMPDGTKKTFNYGMTLNSGAISQPRGPLGDLRIQQAGLHEALHHLPGMYGNVESHEAEFLKAVTKILDAR